MSCRRGFHVAIRRILIGMTLVVGLAGRALGADEENQCVACHQREVLPISLGHSFDDWRGSAHRRGGVGCEKCHGGDATAKDAAAAHRGVLPAAEADSLVNPTKLSATCGGCHPKELAAYRDTVHAREVTVQGKGATCGTCHGAMATSLPSPNELSARCAVCHQKSVQVQAALAVLATAKTQLHRTQAAVERTRKVNPTWHQSAVGRFHELERTYASIQLDWHHFKMGEVLQRSLDVLKLSKAISEEAEVVGKPH